MKPKIFILSVLGAASLGLSQAASANWQSGICPQPNMGPAPCIEWSDGTNTYHFNGDGGQAGEWHGHPNGGSFNFKGRTTLICDNNTVECDLGLDGRVRKDYDPVDGTWKVSIEVSDATVDNGLLCGFVNVSGFPWYIDENDEHGSYTSAVDVGIPYNNATTPPIDFIGSIGPIGVSVPLLGINVTNGHMHDITYDNSNTFSFGTGMLDENIYASDETLTGCTVSGDLDLQPLGDILTIY